MHNMKKESMMKRQQTGEVMLVMMVVMMTIIFISRGHIGMMGHGHATHSAETAAQPQTAPPEKIAPVESTESQR